MLSFEERSCPRRVATIAGLLVIGSLLLGSTVAADDGGHFNPPKQYYLALGSTVAADDGGHFNPPKQYYLALGDSEAFGFQDAKFQQEIHTNSYDPASFSTGYVDDFAAMLRTIRPHIQMVNFSCPGETSATFIGGNCPFHNTSRPLPLHNNYPLVTPQLAAAMDFLRDHRGKVSPITIDIGSNDVQNLFLGTCNKDIPSRRRSCRACWRR